MWTCVFLRSRKLTRVVITDCKLGEWNAWSKCSDCHGSTVARYTNLSPDNEALPETCVQFLLETKICGFPCGKLFFFMPHGNLVDETVENQKAIVQYLYDSYRDFDWLQNQAIMPVNLTITKSEFGKFVCKKEMHTWQQKKKREPHIQSLTLPRSSYPCSAQFQETQSSSSFLWHRPCHSGFSQHSHERHKLCFAEVLFFFTLKATEISIFGNLRTHGFTIVSVSQNRFIGPNVSGLPGDCLITIGVTEDPGIIFFHSWFPLHVHPNLVHVILFIVTCAQPNQLLQNLHL